MHIKAEGLQDYLLRRDCTSAIIKKIPRYRSAMLLDVDGHDDDSPPSTEYPLIVSGRPEAGAPVNDGRTSASELHYNCQRNRLAFDGASAIASHT